jgi:hypothetical protein
MLTIRLKLKLFLDRSPAGGFNTAVTLRLIPLFEREPPPPKPGTPPDEIDTEPRIIEDELHARKFTQSSVSQTSGQVELSFDISNALRLLKNIVVGGKKPVGIIARAIANVQADGLSVSSNLLKEDVSSPDMTFERILIIDLAKSIVGHTTSSSVRLWFQLHGQPATGTRFVCELERSPSSTSPGPGEVTTLPVTFNAQRARTAVVDFTGLPADTAFTYSLRMRQPGGIDLPHSGILLTRGEFHTAASSEKLSFIFASCNLPTSSGAALNRWQRLAARTDYDMLLLIGDQIYGDGIEKHFPNDSWLQRYIKRYNQLWVYAPFRQVLGRTPTYMTLDDHDVTDDWGIVEIPQERINAALQAYRIFQQAHSPLGFASTNVHYHFRRGPAAFFLMDSRSHRGLESDFPIFGRQQFNDIVRWAASDEARSADLIFFVAPVPPAYLPIDLILDAVETVSVETGVLVGALIGGLIGGPVGAGIGALAGGIGADIAYNVAESDINEPDFKDQWNFEKNQPDVARLMNLLFDLANDIQNGQPGPHPRAVFILGGDVHLGAMFHITSDRIGGGHDHRRNPTIFEFVSSAISHTPVDSKVMVKILESAPPSAIDNEQGSHYTGHLDDFVVARNFGRFEYEHLGGRRYRFYVTVEGETRSLVKLFELDLDATRIEANDLIGDVLSAQGHITLLRVHEPGSGFGPDTDRLDAEVIVQFDTEPGRGFGFQLRKDGNGPAHRRMLDILRTAFNRGLPVRIDYVRTGLRNGEIIRVTDLV